MAEKQPTSIVLERSKKLSFKNQQIIAPPKKSFEFGQKVEQTEPPLDLSQIADGTVKCTFLKLKSGDFDQFIKTYNAWFDANMEPNPHVAIDQQKKVRPQDVTEFEIPQDWIKYQPKSIDPSPEGLIPKKAALQILSETRIGSSFVAHFQILEKEEADQKPDSDQISLPTLALAIKNKVHPKKKRVGILLAAVQEESLKLKGDESDQEYLGKVYQLLSSKNSGN